MRRHGLWPPRREGVVSGPSFGMDNQAKGAVEGRTAPIAPVEAEREFVEIGGKVVREYRTFVGSEEPPLQIAYNQVDHRQVRAGLFSFRCLSQPGRHSRKCASRRQKPVEQPQTGDGPNASRERPTPDFRSEVIGAFINRSCDVHERRKKSPKPAAITASRMSDQFSILSSGFGSLRNRLSTCTG